MISIINGHYVVQLPELGVYQDIDPSVGQPFASEAAAQAWLDTFLASLATHQAAELAAEQARLAALMHIDVTIDKPKAMLGDTITLTATVKNGLGATVPLTQAFAVPVEDGNGTVTLIKLASFVNGVATAPFKPTQSGYFCITEKGINHKLPPGVFFGLPNPVEVVVYE
jgi:hypothetical protein